MRRCTLQPTCAVPVIILASKSTSNSNALCVTLISVAFAKELYSLAMAPAAGSACVAAEEAAAVTLVFLSPECWRETDSRMAEWYSGSANTQSCAARRDLREGVPVHDRRRAADCARGSVARSLVEALLKDHMR